MIKKVILNPNEDLSPAVLEWKESEEDYIVDVPKGITRAELVDLTEEIKRLTKWRSNFF